MEKLKVCIPTKDEKNIYKGHMGDADLFMIYEWDGKDYKLVEKKKNVPFEEKKHGDQKKMQHILSIVGECEVFVGGVSSPNFLNLRDKTKVQPVVSKIEDIEKTFEALNKNAQTIEELTQKRKNGEHPRVIPQISEDETRLLS
ncbi:NifB/NifX family molybdenum-iron cluster-binding protein [Mesoaciditoga sp.]